MGIESFSQNSQPDVYEVDFHDFLFLLYLESVHSLIILSWSANEVVLISGFLTKVWVSICGLKLTFLGSVKYLDLAWSVDGFGLFTLPLIFSNLFHNNSTAASIYGFSATLAYTYNSLSLK